MKLLAALLLLATAAAPAPEPRYFHFERAVKLPPNSSGQTCLVLDPDTFARVQPQFADLRLYRGDVETPYVIRSDSPVAPSQQRIAPLNLGRRDDQTVFDLAMPPGKYSDLELEITAHDFIATVTVTGSQTQASAQTRVGSYTIFDLTRQKLGRSTVLHLPESDYRYLHFRIAGAVAPGNVGGLSVQRLPAGEPRYQIVAVSSQVEQVGHGSVIEFTVASHTPVDRIVFVPGYGPVNFSRDVKISASPISQSPASDADQPPSPVASSGNLLSVHRLQDGHRIDEEHLILNAPSADFDTAAKWTVTIENGDDSPIRLGSVRLEMLQRNLCFDAVAGADYTLRYGDRELAAPQYDYAALFSPQQNAVTAIAESEQPNINYELRPDERPFTEKHPILLWAALGLVVVILAAVALRSARFTG